MIDRSEAVNLAQRLLENWLHVGEFFASRNWPDTALGRAASDLNADIPAIIEALKSRLTDAGKVVEPAAGVVVEHRKRGLTADMIAAHYPQTQHQPDECELCHAVFEIAKEAIAAPVPAEQSYASTLERVYDPILGAHLMRPKRSMSAAQESDALLAGRPKDNVPVASIAQSDANNGTAAQDRVDAAQVEAVGEVVGWVNSPEKPMVNWKGGLPIGTLLYAAPVATADHEDAERYRWLRDESWKEPFAPGPAYRSLYDGIGGRAAAVDLKRVWLRYGRELDAAIDSARAPSGKGGERG